MHDKPAHGLMGAAAGRGGEILWGGGAGRPMYPDAA